MWKYIHNLVQNLQTLIRAGRVKNHAIRICASHKRAALSAVDGDITSHICLYTGSHWFPFLNSESHYRSFLQSWSFPSFNDLTNRRYVGNDNASKQALNIWRWKPSGPAADKLFKPDKRPVTTWKDKSTSFNTPAQTWCLIVCCILSNSMKTIEKA